MSGRPPGKRRPTRPTTTASRSRTASTSATTSSSTATGTAGTSRRRTATSSSTRTTKPTRTSTPIRRAAPEQPTTPKRSTTSHGAGTVVGLSRKRASVMLGVILATLLVLAGRLVYVQVIAGPSLSSQALEWRLRHVEIPATRGDIVDANGVVMAYSVDSYTLVANQRHVADWKRTDADGQVIAEGPAGVAKILAPMLGMSIPELAAKLMGDDQYVIIAKKVPPKLWEQIQAERLGGITSELTTERVYPAGNTAGSVIGFTNFEGVGQAGIEQQYNDLLDGDPGERTFEISGGMNPQPIPGTEYVSAAAVAGQKVHLTLDQDIQWFAQQTLDKQVAATGAESGMIVVLDVTTGKVLALVDSADMDPNNPGESDPNSRVLHPISDVFDPGSTSKVITMAAVLQEGIATPTSQFVVPDTYTTSNGQTFKDAHEHEPQQLTLNGILAQSSNAGTVMVGQHLTPQQRYDYLTAFGYGSKTGLGLPGESAGILHPVDKWDGRTQYGVLFGQGVSATALQSVSVFATIANGGVRIQPTIVSGLTDANGVFTAADPAEQTQVIAPETAATVMQMLESVTEEGGTGTAAQVSGYRIAGKTGTAQITGPSGRLDSIMASFIGVAPADNPQIAVGVFLKNPSTSIWGGVVAAPVFASVTGFTLSKLSVPPSDTPAELIPTTY